MKGPEREDSWRHLTTSTQKLCTTSTAGVAELRKLLGAPASA